MTKRTHTEETFETKAMHAGWYQSANGSCNWCKNESNGDTIVMPLWFTAQDACERDGIR